MILLIYSFHTHHAFCLIQDQCVDKPLEIDTQSRNKRVWSPAG